MVMAGYLCTYEGKNLSVDKALTSCIHIFKRANDFVSTNDHWRADNSGSDTKEASLSTGCPRLEWVNKKEATWLCVKPEWFRLLMRLEVGQYGKETLTVKVAEFKTAHRYQCKLKDKSNMDRTDSYQSVQNDSFMKQWWPSELNIHHLKNHRFESWTRCLPWWQRTNRRRWTS